MSVTNFRLTWDNQCGQPEDFLQSGDAEDEGQKQEQLKLEELQNDEHRNEHLLDFVLD